MAAAIAMMVGGVLALTLPLILAFLALTAFEPVGVVAAVIGVGSFAAGGLVALVAALITHRLTAAVVRLLSGYSRKGEPL